MHFCINGTNVSFLNQTLLSVMNHTVYYICGYNLKIFSCMCTPRFCSLFSPKNSHQCQWKHALKLNCFNQVGVPNHCVIRKLQHLFINLPHMSMLPDNLQIGQLLIQIKDSFATLFEELPSPKYPGIRLHRFLKLKSQIGNFRFSI